MKKALALSMALAMSAAMLAGCGGSASDSTSASGAASSADSAASGTPTVSFMIPDFTGHVLSNEHSDEVIAKYEPTPAPMSSGAPRPTTPTARSSA